MRPDLAAQRGSEGQAPQEPLPVSKGAKAVAIFIALAGISLSLFQLYTAGVTPLNLFYQRGGHLLFILILAFLMFPSSAKPWVRWPVDLTFMFGGVAATGYLIFNLDTLINRAGFFIQQDIVMGTIGTVVVLEAARRVIGPTISIIGVVFILYAMTGPRGPIDFITLPGVLQHRGYDVDRIVAQLWLGQEGIFGIPLGVAATFVYIFILFGAFLEITGAGQFFIDLAYAGAGKQRGGPAKASVIASGFMGSISGSAIANVVTTGAFTIPLMKKLGYKPEEAGGVEAAASTGGQIMPPIMGAGAFLIAEYTRVPYVEIVRMAILPAILYFSTVYLFVDIIAAKRGMQGMAAEELPKLKNVIARGWHFLVPLGILIWYLLQNISPARVGFVSIVAILVVSALRYIVRRIQLGHAPTVDKDATMGIEPGVPQTTVGAGLQVEERKRSESWVNALARGFVHTVQALEIGARNAVPVSVATAVAGVVVGVVGLTGLGLKFSSLMLSLSGGNIIAALLLVIVASLILGMGLPVTASYIVLIVLTGPALTQEFGIPLIVAHLLVFWYSQDSNVTPPVALAAFAGAGIANSNPMRTGVEAWKFAKGLYLVPLFMVFHPQIVLGGPWLSVVWAVLLAIAALGAFAAALEGFLFTRMVAISRVAVGLGVVAVLYSSLWVQAAGFGVIVTVLLVNWIRSRGSQGQVAAA